MIFPELNSAWRKLDPINVDPVNRPAIEKLLNNYVQIKYLILGCPAQKNFCKSILGVCFLI